jgi:hypothetical protein
VDHNRAVGGDGNSGGNGGKGLGGGIYQDTGPILTPTSLTLAGATVVDNHAVGGAAGTGGSDGQGIGGGIYVTAGGVACADVLTVIGGNHASTSDDEVFGDLGSC